MPSSRCFVSSVAARFQSAGVDFAGSMPSASIPALPSSVSSDIIPTLPVNAGSKRSLTLVISRPVMRGS